MPLAILPTGNRTPGAGKLTTASAELYRCRMRNTKKHLKKKAQARVRTVGIADAQDAIVRLTDKKDEHIRRREKLRETLGRLEAQHADWAKTIDALREAIGVLDGEVILLNVHIGDAYDAITK